MSAERDTVFTISSIFYYYNKIAKYYYIYFFLNGFIGDREIACSFIAFIASSSEKTSF